MAPSEPEETLEQLTTALRGGMMHLQEHLRNHSPTSRSFLLCRHSSVQDFIHDIGSLSAKSAQASALLIVDHEDINVFESIRVGFKQYPTMPLVAVLNPQHLFPDAHQAEIQQMIAELMNAGCTDIVFKDRIAMLPIALERAWMLAELKTERHSVRKTALNQTSNEHTLTDEGVQIVTDSAALERSIKMKTISARKVQRHEFRERFQKVMAHELRTPLAGAKVSADIIERYVDTLSREEFIEHSREISASVAEIETLWDNLLLSSKVEAAMLVSHPENVSLTECAKQEIAAAPMPLCEKHTITLTSSNPDIITPLDRYLFHQIIGNLLSNALKYSPLPAHPIKVSVDTAHLPEQLVGALRPSPEQGLQQGSTKEYARLTVSDAGVGIAEHDMSMIFQPFFRGSNIQNIAGSGLGLYIVKQCVALHRGTIELSSVLGEGTTITVYLPLAKA